MLDVYQKFTRYYIIYIYTYVWKNKKEMKETRSHYLPSRLNKQKKTKFKDRNGLDSRATLSLSVFFF